MKKWITVIAVLFISVGVLISKSNKVSPPVRRENLIEIEVKDTESEKSFIKWAEFNVSTEMLEKAYKYDVESKGEKNWINLLAYASAKSWGNTDKRCLDYIDEAALMNFSDENTEYIKNFGYYKEIYTAVLGDFVKATEKGYGIAVYSPIAKNFNFSHYKDFGDSRSYGYMRQHMGNDLLGAVGTPVICVEGGTVEAMGWNQYGGWRIGIRSNDKKRYYYYAHLRKDHPFNSNIKEGDKVEAGEVIGYLGMTGYSVNENVNNLETPHLHFGVQLIFNESQKDGSNQIWIDVYDIIEFLEKNKSEVEFDEEKKEYVHMDGKA